MKRFLFYLSLLLTFSSLQAQVISIAEARSMSLESSVTVSGIVTSDGEFGGTRYLQDATAGIATFNSAFAGEVKPGDEVIITGNLSEFNNLLQVSGDNFAYQILSSDNPLPEAKTLTAAEGYSEAYESQLVRFENVLFPEGGTFPNNSTNYEVTIGEDMNTYALRVDGRTDIGGADIPTERTTAIGIMGQFQDTYQLLPRSRADLGLESGNTGGGDVITMAEARNKNIGEMVTAEGIITTDGEFGGVRYFQDETAGLAIFSNDLAAAVKPGDMVKVSGELTEFNNLLQIGANVAFEVLSSDNPMPEAQTLMASEGYSETYESQLVRFEGVRFPEAGVFPDNSTNYDVMIGENMGTYTMRVDGRTDIGGADIPTEAITAMGIMGQFQDTYQLLPRNRADLGLEGGNTGGGDVITMAEARTKNIGEMVTVEGIITTGGEFGGVRYFQDETAGLAIFSNDLAATVTPGDMVKVSGELTEFNNLLQVGANVTFEILSSGNPMPEAKTLMASEGFTGAYQSQLVRYEGVLFPEAGTFADNSTNYEVTIGESMDTYTLRVDGRTDIGGTMIPEEPIAVTGIMGQFGDTHQLLPRSLADFGGDSGAMTIAEARTMMIGEMVSIEGIITTGGEFGGARYIQDATAGIGLFNPDLAEVVQVGDKVAITGPLSEFNNLMQISGDGFMFEILSSGNDLPEPKTLTASEGFSEDYEAQLVRFEGVMFPETGTFPSNSTNYDVMIDGGTYTLRVDGRTDIGGAMIPEEATAVVGIMGQFQDTYQLLPRSRNDLGLGGNTGGDGVITIAEARSKLLGETVTVQGIVTNGAEFGAIRYFQDETAGLAVFAGGDVLTDVELGDEIKVTGQLSEFRNLLEITDEGGEFSVEVISKGNMVPEPVTGLLPPEGYKEDYEAQLIRFDNVEFFSTGNFAEGSGNYQIRSGLGLYEVRVNGGTDIAGTPIPQGLINITGLMGQFQDNYQLLPRSLQDFEFVGNPPVFTSGLMQSNMEKTSFDISFTTENPGTTIIRYGLTEALEGGEIVSEEFVTDHLTTLTGLEAGQIYYVQAESVGETGDASISSIEAFATISNSTGHIDVFFNRKVDTSVATHREALFLPFGIPDTLIHYINNAKYSVDLTSFTLDSSNGIMDAIMDAHNRGVVVRLVTDADAQEGTFNQFPGPKIRRPAPPAGEIGGIQHNKFVIIDADSPDPNEPLLWTGSTNLTDDQLNVDPNNVIIFQDQSLARAFTIEFEEMLGGSFGENKRHNTPTDFWIGGRKVELYFTPSEDPQQTHINTIRSADYELYFAILSFTRNNVAYAMVDEHEEGTYVAGIIDDDYNPFGEGVDYPYGILVDNIGTDQIIHDDKGYIFHHKTLIVDQGHPESDALVWTGSYNWSNSARFRNDENIVVVHSATIANLYYQEFSQRFKELGGTLMVGIDDVTATTWRTLLFPNPAKQTVTLQFSAEQATDATIRIQSLTGQVVYSNFIENAQNEKLSIDVQDLPNGVYILNVNNQTEKLVINN